MTMEMFYHNHSVTGHWKTIIASIGICFIMQTINHLISWVIFKIYSSFLPEFLIKEKLTSHNMQCTQR